MVADEEDHAPREGRCRDHEDVADGLGGEGGPGDLGHELGEGRRFSGLLGLCLRSGSCSFLCPGGLVELPSRVQRDAPRVEGGPGDEVPGIDLDVPLLLDLEIAEPEVPGLPLEDLAHHLADLVGEDPLDILLPHGSELDQDFPEPLVLVRPVLQLHGLLELSAAHDLQGERDAAEGLPDRARGGVDDLPAPEDDHPFLSAGGDVQLAGLLGVREDHQDLSRRDVFQLSDQGHLELSSLLRLPSISFLC